MSDYGTDKDRSEAYESDPLVRVIEDFMRKVPPAKRLYPDLYSEDLAREISLRFEFGGD